MRQVVVELAQLPSLTGSSQVFKADPTIIGLIDTLYVVFVMAESTVCSSLTVPLCEVVANLSLHLAH